MADQKVQDAFSKHIPGDEVYKAGASVVGSPEADVAANLRYVHENMTGGIAPGNAALHMDSSSEAKTPHDHSGTIGTGAAAVDHGTFLPRFHYWGKGERWGSIYNATASSQAPLITSLASSGWLQNGSFDVFTLQSGNFSTAHEIDLSKWTTTTTTHAVLIGIVPMYLSRGCKTVNVDAYFACNNSAASNVAWTTTPDVFCAIYNNSGPPAIIGNDKKNIVQNGFTPLRS